MTQLINHEVSEYKICYYVALRAKEPNSRFYVNRSTLLLKLANPATILFNIQIENLYIINLSIAFNLNHQHFVSI